MFEMAGWIDLIDNRVMRHLIRACNVKTECELVYKCSLKVMCVASLHLVNEKLYTLIKDTTRVGAVRGGGFVVAWCLLNKRLNSSWSPLVYGI